MYILKIAYPALLTLACFVLTIGFLDEYRIRKNKTVIIKLWVLAMIATTSISTITMLVKPTLFTILFI